MARERETDIIREIFNKVLIPSYNGENLVVCIGCKVLPYSRTDLRHKSIGFIFSV